MKNGEERKISKHFHVQPQLKFLCCSTDIGLINDYYIIVTMRLVCSLTLSLPRWWGWGVQPLLDFQKITLPWVNISSSNSMIFQMNLFCMFWGSFMTICIIFLFFWHFVLWCVWLSWNLILGKLLTSAKYCYFCKKEHVNSLKIGQSITNKFQGLKLFFTDF